MGKNLIQQRRGKGTPRYRAPSFRFIGSTAIPRKEGSGIIRKIIHSQAHTAPLIEVEYEDGTTYLHCAPEGVAIGEQVMISNGSVGVKPGNAMPLQHIPEGTSVHNIELRPGDGGKVVRSAGSAAKVLAKTEGKVTVILPSKKKKEFLGDCRATVGIVAGGGRIEKPFYKAGKKFHLMKAKHKLYPKVSGAAMNAVDHPFGGSRSSRKGRSTVAPKNAPPGRKVGMLRPRRMGRKKR